MGREFSMVGAGSTQEVSPESQDGQTVMRRNGTKAGGTLDWAWGRHVGSPGRTGSGTFPYGGEELRDNAGRTGVGVPDGG